MAKIYVAARYDRMVEMRGVHAELLAAGHEPTSRWVEGGEEAAGMTQREAALMDVQDVTRADVLLLYIDARNAVAAGGGRFFEMGYAYAMQKLVVTVGPQQIIFHHLPDTPCFASLAEALRYVGEHL